MNNIIAIANYMTRGRCYGYWKPSETLSAREWAITVIHNQLATTNVGELIVSKYIACYVFAHNQFAYIEERSNEPL